MKIFIATFIFSTVLLFSCTDRDDNLEGVQIRVQNATETTFQEVIVDSLIYMNVEPNERTFYEGYEGNLLPNTVILISDSLEFNVTVDNTFEIDTTRLNLFTFRIKAASENAGAAVEVLRD